MMTTLQQQGMRTAGIYPGEPFQLEAIFFSLMVKPALVDVCPETVTFAFSAVERMVVTSLDWV